MLKRDELTNPASCMSRARDDEMTFVLLGRDVAAPAAIREWIKERVRLGKNFIDDAQIREAEQCIASIIQSNPRAGAAYETSIFNDLGALCRKVRSAIESYGGGDRPPSPPAWLLSLSMSLDAARRCQF